MITKVTLKKHGEYSIIWSGMDENKIVASIFFYVKNKEGYDLNDVVNKFNKFLKIIEKIFFAKSDSDSVH